MQKFILVVLLICATSSHSSARLGETEEQSVARYGDVFTRTSTQLLGKEYPMVLFKKNGYRIATVMDQGKTMALYFGKDDGSEISDDQIVLILGTEESANLHWKKSSAISMNHQWNRDDGALAQYDIFKKSLLICSAQFVKLICDDQKADDAQKTSTF